MPIWNKIKTIWITADLCFNRSLLVRVTFRLWCRYVPELNQAENVFWFYLQSLYFFPEVNLVFKLRFLLCSYLESINKVVSPASFKACVLFYKDMPPGTLRNYAGTWTNFVQNTPYPVRKSHYITMMNALPELSNLFSCASHEMLRIHSLFLFWSRRRK